MGEVNHIAAYHAALKSGEARAGRWVHMLYDKITDMLDNGALIYDAAKADDAINWIEAHCFHVEGVKAPGNLLLEPWQKAFVACIFGLIDPATGLRQFREVLLIVGRKNGKSALASALENYVFQREGGYGARVFNLAPKLEQADIIYQNTWQMIQLDPYFIRMTEYIREQRLKTHMRVADDDSLPRRRVSDIYKPDTNATIKKITLSHKKSDGFNPSLCICDEIAAWEGDKGLKAYEVMKSGMGARPEGIMLSCSTAGYVHDSIYDELVKRGTRYLLGDSEEKRLLPVMYMIDDPDKWDDSDEWAKANPNIGVSVTQEYLQDEYRIACGSLSKKVEFLTKYCNIKQNSSQAWLSAQAVERCAGAPLNIEDFRGCYCVGGIDLSQTRDLTACCVVIEKDKELYVFTQFFMPRERLGEASSFDGVPYNIYVQRGLLRLSGDNFVDYHDCYQWFVDLVTDLQVLPLKVGYDRYSAQYLVQDMAGFGFHMDDVYQGENLYPIMQELQGMIEDGKIHIGDNDLLKIHLLNSAQKMSIERGRGKLVKLSARSRIDGTAALLDAMTVRQKYYAEIGEQLMNGG